MSATAPYDDDGVAVPAGWTADKTVDPGPCGRVSRVALSIPGVPYAPPGDLGLQDPEWFAAAWYHWDRYREMMQWLYQGQPFADSLRNAVSNATGNFSEPFEIRVSAIDGERVTLDSTFSPARKLVSRLGEMIRLQPGDMVRLAGAEALVVRLDPSDPNAAFLHKPIDADTPLLGRVYREMDRPTYPYLAPYRALWVERHTTDWIPSGDVVDGYTLKRADGVTDGRIAWPIARSAWRETFRVLARTVGGAVVDVTAAVLAHFAGGDHWLSFEQTGGGTAAHTALDLTALTVANAYTAYRIDYCPEVASQADPGAGGVVAYRPTQSACRYVMRDWSDSILSQHDGVVAGVATDSEGARWYCGYAGAINIASAALIPSDIIAQFAPMCNMTRCPAHAINVPWRPSSAAVAALLLGRDKFSKRDGPYEADPQVWRNGRAQQPGLHWLVGCPVPSHDTAQPPLDVAWYGVGGWGYLEDVPDTDGLLKRIRSGAIDEDNSGVLAHATYPDKGDRAGGPDDAAQAQYDDGSDWLEIESAHPSRRCASIGMGGETVTASGDCEAAVQRIRRHPLIVPDIRKGTDGVSPDGVVIAWSGDTLRLTVPALGATIGQAADGRPFPTKNIPALVHNAEILDGLLWITFSPGVVRTQSIGIASEVSTWLASGATVSPPPWREIRNPYSGERSRYQALTERLCRGDTIRFPGLGGALGNTRLTCVFAQAFEGPEYTGDGVPDPENPETLVPPNATAAANTPGIPEWYQTQSQRLAMDVAAFDISGHLAFAVADLEGALAGQSGVVDSAAAFPPAASVINLFQPSTGNVREVQATGYGITIRHWIDGEVGLPIPTERYQYDPANGIIDLDTDGWSLAATHCLEFQDADGTAAPWRITRENTLPAEIMTAMQVAHESAQWCRSGNLLQGADLAIRSRFNWAVGEYGIVPMAPNTVALRPFWVSPGELRYTWAAVYDAPRVVPGDVLPFAASGAWDPALKAQWDAYFELQADGARFHSDGNFAWSYSGPPGWPDSEDLWIMRQAPGSGGYRAGIYFGSDGGWDNPDLRGVYQAYRLELTPDANVRAAVPPLRRWRSDWIAEALIDIKISGATRYTRRGTYVRNPDSGAYVSDPGDPVKITQSGDLSLTLALLAAEEYRLEDEHPPDEYGGPSGDAVRFSPLGQMSGIEIAQANQGEWVTIDVTDLCRLAAQAATGLKIHTATIDGDGYLALTDMATSNLTAVDFVHVGQPLTLVADEPADPWPSDAVWYDESNARYVFAPALAAEDIEYSYLRDIYIAVTGAGDAADSAPTVFETINVQDLFYGSVSRWRREYGIYEPGTEASGGGVAAVKTSDAINSHWVEYDGVQFRDLKIRLDWDAFRTSQHLPHIAYGVDGQAGHWPVDEVADL